MRTLTTQAAALKAIMIAADDDHYLAQDAANMFGVLASDLVEQAQVDLAVAYATAEAAAVRNLVASMDTAAEAPKRRRRGTSDLRPSIVKVAQTLVELSDGHTTHATNADLAAASGLGKAHHNAASVARALRAMTARHLITRTYDPHTRQRTITIYSDDLVAAVKALVA